MLRSRGSGPSAPRGAIGRAARMARSSPGARASAFLLAGAIATMGGSYAYNIVCIRWLGPRDYGDVAALTALATILLLPLLGLQAALAREVAAFRADQNEPAASALIRLAVRRTIRVQAAVLGALLALSPAIRELLNIGSLASAAAAAVFAAVGVAMPVYQGLLQGLDRFRRIGLALTFYGLARPLLVMPLIFIGFGVAGAITASTIAVAVAATLMYVALRGMFRNARESAVSVELKDFKPVIVGLLAFTVVVNADVLVAKAFLAEHTAGTYASAALVGKLAALLPAGVIAPVLLPRATARLRRGHDVTRLVAAALVTTILFGVALAAVLFAVPRSLVEAGFGEQFGDARDLLGPVAAVMILGGVINVNLTFAFARRDLHVVKLLTLAVIVQAILFVFLHDSPYQILAATALAALVVIVPHELRSPVATWRLLRAS